VRELLHRRDDLVEVVCPLVECLRVLGDDVRTPQRVTAREPPGTGPERRRDPLGVRAGGGERLRERAEVTGVDREIGHRGA
jgi:hypothetical protein